MFKKKILPILLSLALLINLFPAFALAAEGTGTADDPYLISTAAELKAFRDEVNAGNTSICAVLADNIDLGGSADDPWTPIGDYAGSGTTFTGHFDGGGFEISGLYINSTADCQGLFGYIGTGGEVANLGVSGTVTVSGTSGQYTGGIAGSNYGTITNCYNTAVVSGYNYVGGIAGWSYGTITNCYNTGAVSGSQYVGGNVGYSTGTVTNCYNTGVVSGDSNVGGNVGYSYSGSVANCYNTGTVSGYSNVGGIAGKNYGTITNCYNTGAVSGYNYVGGNVGLNTYSTLYTGTVTNCYNTGAVSGSSFVGGNVGLNTRTVTNCYYLDTAVSGGIYGVDVEGSAEPLTAAEFAVTSNFNNWDFDTVWGMDALLGRPVLQQLPESVFTEGNGTEENPYLIPDLETLELFRDYINAGSGSGEYFKLTANIDLSSKYGADINGEEISWTPIGDYTGSNVQFTGSFDGNGYEISGLYINTTANYQGLFGYIGSGGEVANLGVSGTVTISGEDSRNAGGIAGYNYGGTITNCYNTAVVSSGYNYVGGIAGYNGNGTITNCYNTGAVSGSQYVGGITGWNRDTITNCYNTGNVTVSRNFIGGIAGYNSDNTTITNCYNTGDVTGRTYVGGIVGYNSANNTITNCYNTGDVTGSGNYVGGNVGDNDNGTITNCYNTGDVTGRTYVGGNVGCSYRTVTNCYSTGAVSGSEQVGGNVGQNNSTVTNCYYLDTAVSGGINGVDVEGSAEPLTAAEFAVTSNFNNWDFDTVWGMDALLGRPVLQQMPESVFTEGNGTEENPYLIPDLETLELFRDYINAGNGANEYFELTANIDLSSKYGADINGTEASWTPIGDYASNKTTFTGHFDGGGYEISGLYINSTADCQGLFGYIGTGGEVANLGVSGTVTVSGTSGQYTGGIAGSNYGTITNCYNTAVVSGYNYVGGIAGYNYGTITNCYNTGAVSGSQYVGGNVGLNNRTVTNCYNTGVVSGDSNVGGITGFNIGGSVANCYNTGTVSGYSNVGGIAGKNYGTITNCYNTGAVSGSQYVGGNVGLNTYSTLYTGTVTNCYNTGAVSGSSFVGGNAGLNTRTVTNCYYLDTAVSGGIYGVDVEGSAEPLTVEEFAVTSNFNNWDFDTVWGMETVLGRPVLQQLPEPVFPEGDGTEENPYLIPDLETLERFRDYINAGNGANEYFELTANIDLSSKYGADINGEEISWTPIGDYASNKTTFTGHFNGNGYEISGLYINSTADYQGLFGYIKSSGTVANLGVSGSVSGGTSASGWYTGGIAGANDGTITNCYNAATVSGYNYVGGIAGYNKGTITNCYNTGAIVGSDSVGGIAGWSYGTITNCYNTGAVSGSQSVGGIVGYNFNASTVTNCYNTGVVSGDLTVGGIAGWSYGTITNCYNTGAVSGSEQVGGNVGVNCATITNCYNTGAVSGSSKVGGNVGLNTYSTLYTGTVTNCYNTGTVSGSSNVGGNVGLNNRTVTNCYYLDTAVSGGGINGADVEGSSQPLMAAEFAVTSNFNNWDFDTVWGMSSLLGRPVLQQIYTNVSEILLDSEKPTSFIIFSGEALTVDLNSYILNGEAVGGVSLRVDGELPDGLSLSDDGIISGDCTAAAGDYSIVIIMEAKNGVVQTLTLTLTVNAPSFLVTIPEQIEADGSSVEISAQDLSMAQNSRLSLCISESTVFELTNGDGDTLSYTVTKADGSEVLAGAEILSVPAAENSGSCELVFTADDPKYAGAYKGTVVFNISVVKASG